jgi:xanthine/uracil/vitamin C permease (AzgA family)
MFKFFALIIMFGLMIISGAKAYNWARKREKLPQDITPFEIAMAAVMVVGVICAIIAYTLNKLGYYPD